MGPGALQLDRLCHNLEANRRLQVGRSDEGVSAQCEKLADISDFTFDYDLIDGQSAMGQLRSSPFHGRLIEMARHRRRLEARAGKCVARRVHY